MHHTGRRMAGVSVVFTALAVLLAACGVVGDGKVESVTPPFGLDDTALPTTTAAATTTAPTTTVPGLETTTTLVQTEAVRLYFITGSQLLYVERALATPAALPQIVAALQEGPPPGDLGAGLRSALPVATITVNDTNAGIATVELPETFFDGIPALDQRLVVGQLVLTLTDSRGIGQVQFNLAVPKASGEVVRAGEPLARVDFTPLLVNAPRG
jgi:hypothetical protein